MGKSKISTQVKDYVLNAIKQNFSAWRVARCSTWNIGR